MILSNIYLTCQTNNSNKWYEVQIVLSKGILSLVSEYGSLSNATKRNGVGGSFVMDVAAAIDNDSVTSQLQKLVLEANAIAHTKTKKGYVAQGGQDSLSLFEVKKALEKVMPLKKNKPVKEVIAATDFLVVQIVDIFNGVIQVADFSYEVLEDVLNPENTPVKIGEVIRVEKRDNVWQLI